jgi:hypothetical protein
MEKTEVLRRSQHLSRKKLKEKTQGNNQTELHRVQMDRNRKHSEAVKSHLKMKSQIWCMYSNMLRMCIVSKESSERLSVIFVVAKVRTVSDDGKFR